MKRVELSDLEKGDLILVRWLDASEIRCSVNEHEGNPEVYCKDWGAARIPLELIDELVLVMPRGEAVEAAIGIGPEMVMPIHWRDSDPEEFKAKVEARSDLKVILMQTGETLTL